MTADNRWVVAVGLINRELTAVTNRDELRVCIWEVESGRLIHTHVLNRVATGWPLALRGRQLLTGVNGGRDIRGAKDAVIQTLDLANGKLTGERLELSGSSDLNHDLIASSDGRFYVCARHSTAAVFDGTTGKEIKRYQAVYEATPECFGRDGSHVVIGKRLAILPVEVGKAPVEIGMDCVGAALSPDARWVATGANGGQLELYDVTRAVWVRGFPNSSAGGHVVDFAPNGTFLAAGCYGGIIRIYDPKTARELHRFTEHSPLEVSVLHVVGNGGWLLSGGYDGKVWLRPIPRDLMNRAGVAPS